MTGPEPMTDTIRLLQVRGNPERAAATSDFLERQPAPIDVATAASAGEGLAALAREPVDCVLADRRLPDMDVLDFLSELRSTRPLLPVIVIADRWDGDAARRVTEGGASDFIVAPGPDRPRHDLLYQRVRGTVENYRAQRSLDTTDYRLRTEQARFRKLFEHSPNCIAFTEYINGQPIIRQINPAFEEVFGYAPEEAVGEDLNELIVPEGQLEEARQLDDEAVGEPWIEHELRRETADGEIRDFLFRGAQVTTRTGTIEGYVIYSDITGRKQRERQLERERDLKEAIRNTLVEVSARGDLEAAFCSSIVDSPYALAWVGERSPSETVAARASAGREAYLDAVGTIPVGGSEPSAAALAGMAPVVVQDVAGADGEWAEAAAAEGLRSAMAVPLVHEGFRYGVFSVYAAEADAFTPEGRQLIEDSAESLAFAIHAARQRESLQAGQPVEVTFDLRGGESYLLSAAEDDELADGEPLHVHRVRTGSDEGSVHFVRAENGGPGDGAFFEAFDPVIDAEAVSTAGGATTFELTVRSPDVVSEVRELGGAVGSITIADGRVRVVARFSRRADVEPALDRLRDRFPGTTILSITGVDRGSAPEAGLFPDLSGKQEAALRAAYFSGFFDRPQGKTADEIASTLGVSRSTFLKHVRTAEATILGAFVEQYSDVDAVGGT